MKNFNSNQDPHRRYNPLLKEWVLVSPHRSQRPWQGQNETVFSNSLPAYDPSCYLCSGNTRASGQINPPYKKTFVFENDFAALKQEVVEFQEPNEDSFFKSKPERGISKVVCFSAVHNVTLPEMTIDAIVGVIKIWQREYVDLGNLAYINYVQIFENKGSVMGCSNPHPHGQIWAQSSLPTQVEKTQNNLKAYYNTHSNSLLQDYLRQELKLKERIVIENECFVALVPFWATWPYETIVISKRHFGKITDFSQVETTAFATILQKLTSKYDNLFNTSFPYSSGVHQAPTDGKLHPEWHFHMHFYPPLLRSATVKKFMVGYEMLGESQRDTTPEESAKILKNQSEIHYKSQNKK